MKINSRLHGAIDYGMAIFLVFSPEVFNLPPFTANFTYALGIIHLILTAITKSEAGILRWIPFRIHGIIELLVSVLLIVFAFYLGEIEGMLPKIFYIAFGAAVLIVWAITDYKSVRIRHHI